MHLQIVYFIAVLSGVFAKWTVNDGSIAIRGGEKLGFERSINSRFALAMTGTLDVSFKTSYNGNAQLAHQSMVQLRSTQDPSLNYMFAPTSAKPMSGAVKIPVSHAAVPVALQGKELDMVLIVSSASDDESQFEQKLTSVFVEPSSTGSKELQEAISQHQLASQKPEIRHTFRPAPHTVSKFIAIIFQAVLVGITGMFLLMWLSGASLGSVKTALSTSPVAHLTFLGSLFALEATFVRYFLGQSIFTTVFHSAVLSPVIVVSGSRALREMANRRLSGESK